MSTAFTQPASTTRPAGTASAPQKEPGTPPQPPISTAGMVKMGLLAVAFVLYFHNWLYTQHRHSWGNHDWSHAYGVPLISLFLMWQHRTEIAATPARIFWPGMVPMLLGMLSYPFFIVGIPNHMGQGYAMILTLMGMTLLLLGPEMMKYLFFPIAYLVFGVTVAEKIMIKVTFKLQQWAAEGGYVLLRILGVNADLKGNTIHIQPANGPSVPLNVAEACSGMSMLIAFIALGVAIALVGCKYWWQRVVLVMAAAPVALLLNVLRIAVLGELSLGDKDLAAGQAHSMIGTLLLVPGFAVYMGIVWALNKSVKEPVMKPASSVSRSKAPRTGRNG